MAAILRRIARRRRTIGLTGPRRTRLRLLTARTTLRTLAPTPRRPERATRPGRKMAGSGLHGRPSAPHGPTHATGDLKQIDHASRLGAGFGNRPAWCPGEELNHRHCDFQSHALPTELPGQTDAGRAREARRESAGVIVRHGAHVQLVLPLAVIDRSHLSAQLIAQPSRWPTARRRPMRRPNGRAPGQVTVAVAGFHAASSRSG